MAGRDETQQALLMVMNLTQSISSEKIDEGCTCTLIIVAGCRQYGHVSIEIDEGAVYDQHRG